MTRAAPTGMDQGDLWERLARRVRPTAGIANIENPRIIGQLVTASLLGFAAMNAVLAALMFWYDEPAAGGPTLGLAVAYAAVLVWYFATGQVVAPALAAALASVADVIIVHLSLGGFAYSGGHFAWGISLTFALVLLLGRREGIVAGVLLRLWLSYSRSWSHHSSPGGIHPPTVSAPSSSSLSGFGFRRHSAMSGISSFGRHRRAGEAMMVRSSPRRNACPPIVRLSPRSPGLLRRPCLSPHDDPRLYGGRPLRPIPARPARVAER